MALRVTAQLAANDMGIPFQQLIVHFLLQLLGIFCHKAKLVDGVGIGAQGEAVHRDLENSDQHGHGKADEIHSRAKGQANAGGGPNAGCRGEALYGAAVFKNHACAQKADAAHHLCGNTRNLFEAQLESNNMSIKDFNVVLELDNMATIKDLVRQNFGVSILARSVCQDEVRSGTLAVLPVENLSMMREINIAYYGEFGQPDVPHDIMKIYNETARL